MYDIRFLRGWIKTSKNMRPKLFEKVSGEVSEKFGEDCMKYIMTNEDCTIEDRDHAREILLGLIGKVIEADPESSKKVSEEFGRKLIKDVLGDKNAKAEVQELGQVNGLDFTLNQFFRRLGGTSLLLSNGDGRYELTLKYYSQNCHMGSAPKTDGQIPASFCCPYIWGVIEGYIKLIVPFFTRVLFPPKVEVTTEECPFTSGKTNENFCRCRYQILI